MCLLCCIANQGMCYMTKSYYANTIIDDCIIQQAVIVNPDQMYGQCVIEEIMKKPGMN